MNALQSLDTQVREILRPDDPESVIDAWIQDLKRTKASDTVVAYSLAVERPYRRWLDRNGLTIFIEPASDIAEDIAEEFEEVYALRPDLQQRVDLEVPVQVSVD